MRKTIAIVLTVVLILLLAACGGGDENTPTNVPPTSQPTTETTTPENTQSETSTSPTTTESETSTTPASEPTRGTRSNPFQFGEDITILVTSRDDQKLTTTYTFNFSEIYIGEVEWGNDVEYYPAVNTTISVESEDDGTISNQLRFYLLTDRMVSYNIFDYHADDVMTGFIDGYYSGVTFDVALRTNTGEITNPDEVNFAFVKIEENGGTIEGSSEIWIAVPEISVRPETPEDSPEPTFSEQELQEIDAQLQGTWTVNAAGAEPVYVFNAGNVSVETVISGVSSGTNTGTYEIGNDDLGNGQLTFTWDNGVEGNLMFTFRDGKLSLIFRAGDRLFEMGKISDSIEVVGSFWDLKHFVDAFNQETDERFISNRRDLRGTFSNSATSDSRVDVLFMVYEHDRELEIAVVMYEYGRNPVVNSSQRNVVDYDILMRTSDGETHEITGTMYEGGDRIFIDWNHRQTVIDALSGSGEIAFRIIQSNRTTTSYLFTIETSNFTNLYQELFEN